MKRQKQATNSQSQRMEFKKNPENSKRIPTTFSETQTSKADTKSQIFNVLWNLKKKGYSEDTIRNSHKALKYLSKHCNLEDSESVKGFVANLEHSNGWKKTLCRIYGYYAEHYNIQFDKPKYTVVHKLPKIPLKESINYIILNASRKYASGFSIIRDTGIRPIECARILVKDIDFVNKTITIRSAKHGLGRIVQIKDNTIAKLKEYIGMKHLSQNNKLYPSAEMLAKMWRLARKRAVRKTKKVELVSIRLYDLRHYYATMLYHKTKDILHVKQQLGHRSIESTLLYTQLIHFRDDEYHVKTATNIEQATKLIECGFEYITEIDNTKLFRKRK